MPSWLIPVVLVIAASWLLLRYLPVGKFHGQPVMLRDWWKSRRAMRIEKANIALKAAEELPANQRLAVLIQLQEEFGEDWLAGDSVRGAIIASGQDDALPWIDRILAAGRYRGLTTSVIKACTSGDAQPHFRVQMFQKLLPLLDSSDSGGSLAGVPSALLSLDREWAVRVLTSPEYLTQDHPRFVDVLSALNNAKVAVPAIKTIDDGDERARLQMARSVATTDSAEGERQLKELMEAGTGERARAAMELAALRGLPHPDRIGGLAYRGGIENLNDRERAVMLAYRTLYAISCRNLMSLMDDDELEGFSLLEMVASLRETGAPARAAWVEAFVPLLGPIASEPDMEERTSGMEALGEDVRSRVSELEEADLQIEPGEYEDDEFFLYRYMLEHEADFERS